MAGVLIIAVSFVACIPRRHHEDVAPRRSLSRDSLLLRDMDRADSLAVRGGSATLIALLAADIVYLRPGAPTVHGRENVLSLVRAEAQSLGAIIAWQPQGAGLSLDRLSGYSFGIAVRVPADRPAPVVERYIAYWQRTRGGPWRIAAYVEVSSVAAVVPGPVAGTAPPTRRLSTPEREIIHSLIWADSNFAERASLFGTASAFAEAIADDGVVMGPDELVVGARAVKEYYDDRRSVSITWEPRYSVGAASGDMGFTIGESITTSRGPSGAAVQRFAKYLTIWRKDENGRFKFVVTGGNARPSPVGN